MRKTDLSRKNQRLFRSVQAFSRPFGSVDEKQQMDSDGDGEARDWQQLREHDPAGLHKLVEVFVFWFLRALYIHIDRQIDIDIHTDTYSDIHTYARMYKIIQTERQLM